MSNNQPFQIDIGQGMSLMVGLPTISSWNIKGRPQKARRGTFGYNSQTNNLEYWNGKNWLKAPLTKG